MVSPLISATMLSEYLVADLLSPTETFYVRNILPFFSNGLTPIEQQSGKHICSINGIIAQAVSERHIPLCHGQTIALNVPGGRITAAYPLMHRELELVRPERIVMLRQLLMDGTLDERIFLPRWYTDTNRTECHVDKNIERRFVTHCIVPWVKKKHGRVIPRELIALLGENYRFRMRRYGGR